MERPDFPSNSSRDDRGAEPKKIERIVNSEVRSRPKSVGKRLKEALIGGDSKTVVQHIIVDVLIPQAKDMIVEAATQGFNRLVYGDDRPRSYRSSSRGSSGYTNYNRYSQRGNNPLGRVAREDRPTASLRPRDLDELVFETRDEASAVLEQMEDILEEYGRVSVADLYAMIGKSSSHTDQKWGWEELQGALIKLVRGGYLLSLPRTCSLD